MKRKTLNHVIIAILVFTQTILISQSKTEKTNRILKVIKTIPAPGTNCQGLTWDGEYLWISDITKDSIYQVDTANGNIVHQIPTTPANHLFEGLAFDGEFLWASHYQQLTLVNPKISKIDPISGDIIQSVTPLIPNSWPHGIAWDGQYIWECDFRYHKIFKIDQNNGAVLDSIISPGDSGCVGLTWYGNYLITADFNTDSIYQISPSSGLVVNQWACPFTNPRDMEYDGKFLWFIARETAQIYKVELIITEVNDSPIKSVSGYKLYQNYPNPFNPSTKIKYSVPQSTNVIIKLFDLLGNEIETLVNEEKPAGTYELSWKASNLTSGVYFYRLQAGSFTETKKIVLLK